MNALVALHYEDSICSYLSNKTMYFNPRLLNTPETDATVDEMCRCLVGTTDNVQFDRIIEKKTNKT